MDDNQGILIEKNGCENLLISFGGIKQNIGMPVFEFYKSLQGIECDKCFVRDFNQAWYHLGVDENCNSIDSVKNHLEKIIEAGNYKKICFVGNSMGGYAAILFGVLLDVNKILVFSPQTFIGKWRRFLYKDKRWSVQINRIHKSKKVNKRYFDLLNIFKENKSFGGTISVYFSKNDKLDALHAKRMKNNKLVNLNEINLGGHNLVRELKSLGKLDVILAELFN